MSDEHECGPPPINLEDKRTTVRSASALDAASPVRPAVGTPSNKAEIVARICSALTRGEEVEAKEIARREYPFEGRPSAGRKYTPYEMTRVFVRDGFTDRYTGQRLVFPGALRMLSRVLPEEFPAHPNWKMAESHMVYWELFPTIDHVVPVARGGADAEPNWVTTSMLTNASKSSWTLEELGWTLRTPADLSEWDGLIRWAIDYAVAHPALLADPYIKRWHNAGVRMLREADPDGLVGTPSNLGGAT